MRAREAARKGVKGICQMKRKRSEILNKLADVIMELDDVREQLKQARETSSYLFERCKELEASENVQGVPFVAAPAGMPGGAGKADA